MPSVWPLHNSSMSQRKHPWALFSASRQASTLHRPHVVQSKGRSVQPVRPRYFYALWKLEPRVWHAPMHSALTRTSTSTSTSLFIQRNHASEVTALQGAHLDPSIGDTISLDVPGEGKLKTSAPPQQHAGRCQCSRL